MRILKRDLRHGTVKLVPDNPEDLWLLSNIVVEGDGVLGRTFRKIKVGEGNVQKKPVFLSINVDKTEFVGDILRVGGVVAEGIEDVSRGSHHTINVELHDAITIVKRRWPGYVLEKLDQAVKGIRRVLIVVFDRDEALIALMRPSGYEILSALKGSSSGKAFEQKGNGDFFEEIINLVKEYDSRFHLETIVFASPSFWREGMMKALGSDPIAKKVVEASCSGVSEGAIAEVLRRDELQNALRGQRASLEISLVDKLLVEINRCGKVVYGFKDVSDVDNGRVDTLLVTDGFIRKLHDEKRSGAIESLMDSVEDSAGQVVVVSSSHSGGQQLDGLGGVAAFLRY